MSKDLSAGKGRWTLHYQVRYLRLARPSVSQELTIICNTCTPYYDSNETVGTNHTFNSSRNLSDGNSVATPVPNSFTLLSNAKETSFQQTSRTKLGATIVVSNPLSKSVYNIWP